MERKEAGEMTEKEKKEYIERINKARLSLHVRTIRKSKGMTEAELAEKAGYETKASIVSIENGNRLPGTGKKDVTDKDIANALDVSLNQLWGRKRIETTASGLAKLSETEKTALTLMAPMMRAMSREGREHVINTALLILKAEQADARWEQTDFQKERKEKHSSEKEGK